MDTRTLRKGAAFAGLALMDLAFTAAPSLAQQQQHDSQQSTRDPVPGAALKAHKAQDHNYRDRQDAIAEQYTRRAIAAKDAKIAAQKKEIEQLKQQISDMEEALRKSGGDPGRAAPWVVDAGFSSS